MLDDKRLPTVPLTEAYLWTIEEFCALHRISISKFYELRRDGTAPDLIYIGNSPRISREAATEWRATMRQVKATQPEGA